MRFLTLAALMFSGMVAQAEVIECVFTEPMFAIKYDTETKQLQLMEMNKDEPTFDIKADYNLVSRDLSEIMNSEEGLLLGLYHDNNGSDGMSDRVYPISGVLTLHDLNNRATDIRGSHYGGCEILEKSEE